MGHFLTVTKAPDGTYVLTFSNQGRWVLDGIEEREGGRAIEQNLENLMSGYDKRLKRRIEEDAIRELRESPEPLTPEQLNRLHERLKKAR